MSTDLQSALREALSATQECNPAELDAEDRVLWHRADNHCQAIIDRLVLEHDECGPEARAILQRFRLPR